MVPRIIAVLTRFKPDWAVQLQPDALQAACQEAGYSTWRDRLLTPVTTIQLFLWWSHASRSGGRKTSPS